MVKIVIAVVLVLSAGTSFMAEGTLPGDALYPVKVNVNEGVRAAVSFSGESKMKWETRRAERRLEESEKLAARGRFDARARATVEARLDAHLGKIESRISRAVAAQRAMLAIEASSSVESSLRAHSAVLRAMAEGDATLSAEVGSFAVAVQNKADAFASRRAIIEVNLFTDPGLNAEVTAEAKLRAAESKLAEVRAFVERQRASVSATLMAQAEAMLSVADTAMVEGRASMEAELYAEAFTQFDRAMRIAQEVEVLVSASIKGNLNLIPGAEINVNGNSTVESEVEAGLDMQVGI